MRHCGITISVGRTSNCRATVHRRQLLISRNAVGAESLGAHRHRRLPLARLAPHPRSSGLVQNGTPLFDLQEIGGWKSAEMVRHYVRLSPAQMAKHTIVIVSLLHDTDTSQHDLTTQQKRGRGTP